MYYPSAALIKLGDVRNADTHALLLVFVSVSVVDARCRARRVYVGIGIFNVRPAILAAFARRSFDGTRARARKIVGNSRVRVTARGKDATLVRSGTINRALGWNASFVRGGGVVGAARERPTGGVRGVRSLCLVHPRGTRLSDAT